MIYFVVREAATWGVDDYLEYWGRSMAPHVARVTYEELLEREELPRGAYIFTLKDELLPGQLELATSVWEQLDGEPGVSLLNHPRRVLGRHALLNSLHAEGLNHFRAARATDDLSDLRFPVFIREERWHTGGMTPLLHTPQELRRSLRRLALRGWRKRDLLVVEFLDTRDTQGIYRKYSAFIVGDTVISRSIQENTDWMVKSGYREVDEVRAREELEYVDSNPHADWVRKVAGLANVDYGRVDYGLLGDQPQAWEINLYPTLVRPSWTPRTTSDEVRALRKPGKTLFFDKLETALKAVEPPAVPHGPVELRIDEGLSRRIRRETRKERFASLHRTTVRRLSQWPPAGVFLQWTRNLGFRRFKAHPSSGTDSG